MFIIGSKNIRSYEKGLLFKNREFKKILGTGRHWFFDPFHRIHVDVVSQRAPWLVHPDLDMIVKADVLGSEATVLDLKDYERALVWMDGRFNRILDSGRHVIWTRFKEIRVEIIDARSFLFKHRDINVILGSGDVSKVLDVFDVGEGHLGVYFINGVYTDTLKPGRYASWKRVGKVKLYNIDMREKVLDISGQEIMTADKVSLRMNTVVSYRVADARKTIDQVNDIDQALYREAQLALRAIVGTRELDTLLGDKITVAEDLETAMRKRSGSFGVSIINIGIRDIILPGDIKDLLNQVIEARKASEANAITRREETAAVRSQLNTARLLDGNPSLMRLHELEVLEKVVKSSKLNIVLGDKGLTERIVNLL